jgi:protein regulator of cytokinesis 1
MRFDLQLESQLESIWHSIGLDSSEIEAHYDDLRQRVTDIVSIFLREHTALHATLSKEARVAEDALRLHMQRFRIEEPDGLDSSATLRIRIQAAKARLEQLTEQTDEQEEEFRSAFAALVECFEILEIDDRGEYADEGNDFGLEKLDRITQLITTLKTDIQKRVPRLEELCAEVDRLRKLLGLPECERPNTVGDATFERLRAEREELEQKFESNKNECVTTIAAINWLERVLKTRSPVCENLKTYGDDQVKKLKARLAQLEQEKEEHIVDFIEAMKKNLLALWGELHIPTPSAADFPFVYNSPASKRTLVALETEVHRLQNLKEHIAPMLDQIAVRDSILADYEVLQASLVDPGRLTSRKGRPASLLIEEERIRKRYTVELPRVHARLIPMLEEYEETFGEPFLWDGEVLLDAVNEMHRKTKSQSHKTSPVRTRPRNTDAIAQRAPFQLQVYVFETR